MARRYTARKRTYTKPKKMGVAKKLASLQKQVRDMKKRTITRTRTPKRTPYKKRTGRRNFASADRSFTTDVSKIYTHLNFAKAMSKYTNNMLTTGEPAVPMQAAQSLLTNASTEPDAKMIKTEPSE